MHVSGEKQAGLIYDSSFMSQIASTSVICAVRIYTRWTSHNRLFMKLSRTKSIDVVKDCQYFFGAVLTSVLVLRKADKLALRYQCLENAFCTYCRSI